MEEISAINSNKQIEEINSLPGPRPDRDFVFLKKIS